jgi:predicted DNA binding CopG/RHH family protein
MSKRLRPIPRFTNEAAERAFWEPPKNDSTEYVDWSKAKPAVFPKLKPSTESISLRMPENLLNTVRSHAQRLDLPYQSLIKLWIAEKVATLGHQQDNARSRGK